MTDHENSSPPNEDEVKEAFHKELYRRDLFRVSLVYLLVGMIAWKGSIILTPMLNLPDQISRSVGIFLVLLFPFAIVLAWVFEMSPGGFVKIGSDKSKANPYSRTKRKPLTSSTTILILLAVAVLLFVIFPDW